MSTKKTMSKKKNTNASKSISVIDDKSIKEYAGIFSNHNLNLLEVSNGRTKIILKKVENKLTTNIVQQASPSPISVQPNYSIQDIMPVEEEKIISAEKTPDSNYMKIVSPISGTFYISPSPDAPPYVKEGGAVTTDTVVCIVEAMKMMNEIKAQINGKIVKRVVDNNTAVETGDVLFLVEQ